jgi:hypothetical protein
MSTDAAQCKLHNPPCNTFVAAGARSGVHQTSHSRDHCNHSTIYDSGMLPALARQWYTCKTHQTSNLLTAVISTHLRETWNLIRKIGTSCDEVKQSMWSGTLKYNWVVQVWEGQPNASTALDLPNVIKSIRKQNAPSTASSTILHGHI